MKKVIYFFLLVAFNYSAMAQCKYAWANWTDQGQTDSATGSLTVNGQSIDVTMRANYTFGFTGDIYNYSYFNSYPDPPPNATVPMTTWSIGNGGQTTMCYSQPVENPVLLLASIGAPWLSVTLNFSLPYQLLFDGGGVNYLSDTSMTGAEGYCIIEFPGTFTCVTIYSNTPEYYTNLTWGIKNPLRASFNYTSACIPDSTFFSSDSSFINPPATITGYSWNFGDGTTSTLKDPAHLYASGGTYNVVFVATSDNLCADTLSKSITVNRSYTVNNPQQICAGQVYSLNQHNYSQTANYYDTLTTVSGCDSVIITQLTVMPAASKNIPVSICHGTTYQLPGGKVVSNTGTYYDTLQTVLGCDSVIVTQLSVNSISSQNISASICPGTTYQLPGGKVVSNTGTYYDTLQTVLGCDSAIIINLSAWPQIQDSVIVFSPACSGGNGGSIALLCLNGSPPYSYRLTGQPENSTGVFNGLTPGNYTYTITDGNGCTLSGNSAVEPAADIVLSVSPVDTTIEPGGQVQILSSCNYPDASFEWSPGTFLSCDTCPSPYSSPGSDIVYNLNVSVPANGNVCTAYAAVTIRVKSSIYIPNAFTPNADGNNDTWGIIASDVKSLDVMIFDRWGEKVFEGNDISEQWDGRYYNGQPAPVGVYVYELTLVNFNDQTTHTQGSITLIR